MFLLGKAAPACGRVPAASSDWRQEYMPEATPQLRQFYSSGTTQRDEEEINLTRALRRQLLYPHLQK